MLFGSVFMFRDPGLSTPYDQLVREMREYVLLMEELGFDYLCSGNTTWAWRDSATLPTRCWSPRTWRAGRRT